MAQPNIVVVLSDQQRPDSCGVFGQRLPVTPVLDQLAARGVAFDQAFTTQPLCGPARAGMQTGVLPTTLGCWRNGLALPPDADTLATRLGALGYATGYIGKWHLASDRGPRLPASRTTARYEKAAVPPDRRGGYRDLWVGADALEMTSGAYGGHLFDEDGEAVELEGYRVDAVTDVAIDRLDRFATDRPFVLFVSFLEPHHQNDKFRIIGPKGWAERFDAYDVPGDLAGWRGDWRWNYAEYLACCASVDANLGRLLDAVERRSQLDDTLVVFSSDHGSHFRTRNLEYKRSGHDASIRVPLVVAGPGFTGGARSDALVTNLDLVPTLVTAAGGEDPAVDGTPWQAALDPAGVTRDDVLVQISEAHIGRALRTRTHTLCVKAPRRNPLAGHLTPGAKEYGVTHLYDNVADPHQRHDRAGDPAFADLRRSLAITLADRIEAAEGRRPRIT
jgi:arylsulfatase A-like enzyme